MGTVAACNLDVAALSANAEAVGLAVVISGGERKVDLRGEVRHFSLEHSPRGSERALRVERDGEQEERAEQRVEAAEMHANTVADRWPLLFAP